MKICTLQNTGIEKTSTFDVMPDNFQVEKHIIMMMMMMMIIIIIIIIM